MRHRFFYSPLFLIIGIAFAFTVFYVSTRNNRTNNSRTYALANQVLGQQDPSLISSAQDISTYTASQITQQHFLGLVPVSIATTTTLSSETNEIISTHHTPINFLLDLLSY